MTDAFPFRHSADALRAMLVRQVREVFHDPAGTQAPVQRSDRAFHPPGSVIWRVHGDVTTMTVGGIAALLMQMLHPAALAGVWDHSAFRDDMIGRLRRTARFIAATTYAEEAEARAAIAHVRRIHAGVRGTMADGTAYAASDPHLLAWVHACEATAFLDAWVAYGEGSLTRGQQDRYFEEAALVAVELGAGPVPRCRDEAETLLARFRPELVVNQRTKEVARLILRQRPPSAGAAPVHAMLVQAAVAILPPWARRLHGLRRPPLIDPAARAGTMAVARALRWAFRR